MTGLTALVAMVAIVGAVLLLSPIAIGVRDFLTALAADIRAEGEAARTRSAARCGRPGCRRTGP